MQAVDFLDVCENQTRLGHKIYVPDYLPDGKYPIIDQSKKYIVAYTNNEEGLYKDVPFIIFGDVTRIFKYIDFPCFLGADGSVILKVINSDFVTKYVYYTLLNSYVPDTGFNRHYKFLKDIKIKKRSIKEQKEIVEILDSINKAIELDNKRLLLLDELSKSRFVEMFMDDDRDKYPLKKWREVVTIKHGKDYKKNLSDENGFPVYGSGGFMGIYADKYLVKENSTIIGRKGTIDKPIFVKEKFWNVDTAFGIEVNEQFLNPVFFYVRSTLYNLKDYSSSTTLPSMTKESLCEIEIGIPPIELQNNYACFVEMIDKSKQNIQKHKDLLIELLNKKMDEYFGGNE